MSWRDRTSDEVIVVLIVLLTAGALLLGGSGGGASSAGTRAAAGGQTVSPQRIARIERRVEGLRGLRFRRPVPVAVVSPARARREGIAEYDRTQPLARRRTNEELLKLLGLLPPDADVRGIEATVFAEQVAGYYDPRRGHLALVRGAGVDDVTLAHELTHALEDQHFDLQRLDRGAASGDDAATAEQALVEGTATDVMEQYAARWPSRAPVGDALSGLSSVTSGTPLPPYTLRTMIFPYIQGDSFVRALRGASGDWRLVNVALRDRPPTTTAEILEPERWLRAERPVTVSLGGAALLRAGGWRRVAGSTLGEEDLAALLAPSSGALAARELTRGWHGGRYALWRRGPLVDPDCAAPCRPRDALLLAARMDSGAGAGAVAAAVGTWLREGLHARPVSGDRGGGGLWRLPGGSSFGAVRVDGTTVHAALAPNAALTRSLAG